VNPVEAREALITAVRRDLYGQDGPADTEWPAAEVKVLAGPPSAIGSFNEWRDVVGPFVDQEGNEVLNTLPTRRYGVGVLSPRLTRRHEQQLDSVQADAAHDVGEDADLTVPVEDDGGGGAHADTDDAATEGVDITRPRSMGVSFLVAAGTNAELVVRFAGGRYEQVPVLVNGEERQFWRRCHLSEELPITTAGPDTKHEFSSGPVRLVLGVVHRPHAGGTIVTVYVVNDSDAGPDYKTATAATVFQAGFEIICPNSVVADYPSGEVLDADDQTLELLYHGHPVRAVGHGCNASCEDTDDGTVIRGEHFPVEVVRLPSPDARDEEGRLLAVDMDALAAWDNQALDAVDALLGAYRKWIDVRAAGVDVLPEHLRDQARRHLGGCEDFLADATDGWNAARLDPVVRQLLQWTSQVMADQRRAYAADTRPLVYDSGRVTGASGATPHHPANRRAAQWRGFQLAFLLATIAVALDPERDDAGVDIIWLPTGGGKTEAYSAAAAFTILWRRYHQVAGERSLGGGATVLMRYTLRLLTAQQLQRAASLICALEQLRRADPDRLGAKKKFTIGAWLGKASTPNDWPGAKKALKEWEAKGERAFLLTRCPWCAAAMGRRPGTGQQKVDGYKLQTVPERGDRVMAYCPDPACPFNHDNQFKAGMPAAGLPVFEVDHDLYTQPPTFVVGTIDKFAQLSWRTEPGALFGLRNGERFGPGPALLIQDELHLISGPLGSLDALYEPIIGDLCQRDGGTRPRVVAATATARRYVEQTKALYGRDRARLIPPPGVTADDNFFARTTTDGPGKIFVGICAPGFGRVQEAQIRALAALSHAAGSLDTIGVRADPWWTNLCFFSSRRSLGLALSLCQTHLRGYTWQMHRATGVHAGAPRATTGTRTAQRMMLARVELTAQATSDVTEALDRLSINHPEKGAVDLCFATSMIEVGVDVDRLGLLTMFGQPKSASQYIQVAGRVGRDERDAPGVVFVLLSPYNSRDRSHFEQFTSFHQRLYASVEPVSITPFTPAALDRGLAGALTAWMRQVHPELGPDQAASVLKDALAPIAARAEEGTTAARNIARRAGELEALIAATSHQSWGTLRPNRAPDGFLRPLGDEVPLADDPDAMNTSWGVPTSMRSVDAESGARTIERTYHRAGPAEAPARTGGVDDEDVF
jgi:hypothetical protein